MFTALNIQAFLPQYAQVTRNRALRLDMLKIDSDQNLICCLISLVCQVQTGERKKETGSIIIYKLSLSTYT